MVGRFSSSQPFSIGRSMSCTRSSRVRALPLITVLKDTAHHPTYRALVIDVGAFTTDFAGIELRPEDDKVYDIDAALSITQHSVPIGVSKFWAASALATSCADRPRACKAVGSMSICIWRDLPPNG